MILGHHGRAGNGRGDRGGVNGGAARALRNAQENGSAFQADRARPLIEAKDCIRAQAGDGQIGEGQFRARFHAGADGGICLDLVVHRGGTSRRLAGKELHVLDDLCDTAFLKRGSLRRKQRHPRDETANQEEGCAANMEERAQANCGRDSRRISLAGKRAREGSSIARTSRTEGGACLHRTGGGRRRKLPRPRGYGGTVGGAAVGEGRGFLRAAVGVGEGGRRLTNVPRPKMTRLVSIKAGSAFCFAIARAISS